MIYEVDSDGDGSIGFSDFLEVMLRQKPPTDDEINREAFKAFDKDGDGFISHDDLKYAMLKAGLSPLSPKYSSVY